MLLLTAAIWGSAFVAQRAGMEQIGPFTMNSIRSFLGALTLLPVIKVRDRKKQADMTSADKRQTEGSWEREAQEENEVQDHTKYEERKLLLTGGICCGLVLAVASSLQQIGLVYTTAGKGGFITAMYILIVPIMGLFLKKRSGIKTWIGVALAVVGMYFLCITDGFRISYGDILVSLCAVAFSVHILVIDYFSPKVDGVKMSCIQFFVCGVVCAVPMLLWEHPEISRILHAWLPVAYAGILSSGVGYTLQIVAQKELEPTVASLLMSLESVFAVLAGCLLLGEELSGRELFGCVLMFAAIILAQLPEKNSRHYSNQ